MPLPLVPLAGLAIRYGAVALAGYGLSRLVHIGRTSQLAEDAMDQTPEGFTAHGLKDADQVNATARFCRVIRLHPNGPGLEIDATTLTRLRLRKVGGAKSSAPKRASQ